MERFSNLWLITWCLLHLFVVGSTVVETLHRRRKLKNSMRVEIDIDKIANYEYALSRSKSRMWFTIVMELFNVFLLYKAGLFD